MGVSGYVDLQVNGFAGVDFNSDDWKPEDVLRACEAMRASGVAKALATLITDRMDRMQLRAGALARAIRSHSLIGDVLAGIHFEGPFISPALGYVGAHPSEHVRIASPDDAMRLVDSCDGLARLVTLAPEQDPAGATTRRLCDAGLIVSAGHCNPEPQQLDRSIDQGLTMFTHLGNGCPLMLPRHDNVIQLVLSRADRLLICFIADGVHVPFHALKNYLRVAGVERSIIVSDAIAAAGCGPGRYSLAGQEVVVDDSGATWSSDRSHLVGSAITLGQVFDNLRHELGFTLEEAQALTQGNACRAIGLR